MKKFNLALIILLVSILYTTHAAGQNRPQVFGILQGVFAKYSEDQTGIVGGSSSGGMLIKKHWGLGVNVQAFKWYPRKYYLPVNLEASYFTDKKFSPYFNIQFGKGIYQHTTRYVFESGPGFERIRGGYYFSPGAGILLPLFGKSKLIVTAAYVRSQMKRKLVVTGVPMDLTENYTLEGYKIGVGIKL